MIRDNSGTDRINDAPVDRGWLLLAVDGLKIAISQAESTSIELVSSLDVSLDDEVQAGWFAHEGRSWPVYALDRRLALQPGAGAGKRFCVMLRASDGLVGLLCDEVRILPSGEDLVLTDIPACMENPSSPLDRMALFEDQIIFVARKAATAGFITGAASSHDAS